VTTERSPKRSAVQHFQQASTRLVARSPNVLILGVLLVLIAIFSIVSPGQRFLSVNNFTSLVANTAEILLLAAGETFIMIAGGIDLSCGSFVVFSAVISAELVSRISASATQAASLQFPHIALGIAAGVVGGLVAGSLWGWINGYVSVRWHVPPFIVTLGTLGMALGAAQLITGGLNVPNVPPAYQGSFGIGRIWGVPWIAVVAAVVVAIMWIVLHQTRFGLRTYAIGSNAEAARRAGVNVGRQQILLYMLMGLMTGIVGILDVARFDTASIAAHTTDNLQAIAAAAIGGVSLYGGKGRMGGTVIGAFIPAVLANGFILLGFQPYWQEVAVGGVLIVAVYIDQVRRREAVYAAVTDSSGPEHKPTETRGEIEHETNA
jgi:ribose transport system permease protein